MNIVPVTSQTYKAYGQQTGGQTENSLLLVFQSRDIKIQVLLK